MAGHYFNRVCKQTAKFIRLLHVNQARPSMRFIPFSAAADFVRNFESIQYVGIAHSKEPNITQILFRSIRS